MTKRPLMILLVLAAVALYVLPASASASVSGTNTFTGASVLNPNDWNQPGNWSQAEVPDGADDVVIPSGKFVNLSLGASGTAKTLDLAGSLSIDGGGVAGGRSLTLGVGTTSLSGVLNVVNGGVLNLGSTTNWSTATVGVGGTGGATVNIGVGDVLNMSGDVNGGSWGPGLWHNQGTINKTTTSGTSTFNNPVENDGTINVSSGTLSLWRGDGAGTSSGQYTAGSGATLRIAGDHELTGTAGIGGTGTVELQSGTVAVASGATFNPTALSFIGATLQLDTAGSVGSISVNGGTRTGSGTLSISGALSVNGAYFILKGGGTTTVGGTTTISAGNFNVQDGHTLNLGPTTNWSGGVVGVGGTGGATVNIGSGDVVNVTGDVWSSDFGAGLWHNQGTINRTTTSGTARFDSAVENDGAINVSSGTLALHGGDGAGSSSGDYTAASGATLSFYGGTHELTGAAASLGGAGTIRIDSGTAVVGAGVTFNPATLSLVGGTLQLDTAGSAGSLSATGAGTRAGSGTLTVSGGMSVSQVLSLQGSGTTTVNGTSNLTGVALNVLDGHTLNLGPTTNWSAGIVGLGGSGDAAVNIGSGDVLNVTGAVNTQGSGGGHWNNQGTINGSPAGGTAAFFKPVTSSGTINVNSGTLAFNSGLTQTAGLTEVDAGTTLGGAVALQGGTLRGAGTASGSVTNTGGTVAPGASPGKLSIGGDYTQSAGTLQVEIAGTGQGTGYDWLAVEGNVIVNGGTLAIVTDPLFAPALSDTFDVVTAGATHTVTGTGFSSVSGAQLSGKAYSVQTTTGPPGRIRLAFSSAPVNGAPPSIPSGAHPGDTITCDPGSWSGSPTSYSYQWLRDGSPIPGATSKTYTVTSGDLGKSITCRVTATNGAGSGTAETNALVPTPAPQPPPPPPPPAPPTSPAKPSQPTAPASPSEPRTETIRGDRAFTEGTANDIYLACTKLDLLLIDVLPLGRNRVYVSGAADLRLAGKTVEIFLGQRAPGTKVGRAVVQPDGSFKTSIRAPKGRRARKAARYQARVGATRSQRLRLERRMVATTLVRQGNTLKLSGVLLRPFTKPAAVIEVERYLSCRRREKVAVKAVRPNRSGRFTITLPAPDGVPAAAYRARTRAPTITTSRIANVFTLPRALDLRGSGVG